MMERNGFEVALESEPSRGLDWSDCQDRKVIADRLSWLVGDMEKRLDGELETEARSWLERRMARARDRLEICGEAVRRDKGDAERVSRECLLRMGESLEAAEGSLLGGEEGERDWDQAVNWFGEGVRYARVAMRYSASELHRRGPTGGLAKIAGLLARPGLVMDPRDVANVARLVNDAMRFSVDQLVGCEEARCRRFFDRYLPLQNRIVSNSVRFSER